MAFQDYKVSGHSPFVGLDNFINLATDSSFWASLGRTFCFVGLNMVLAFPAPIFLAALHSIPRELYEAADTDGAGMFSKLRHVTLPSIMPLTIINFVGAFIGTFQNMGNIFLKLRGSCQGCFCAERLGRRPCARR